MVINRILSRFARLAAGKTVREDLIKYLIGYPLRSAVRQIDRKLLQPRRRKAVEPLRREPQLAVGPQQLEAVTPTRLPVNEADFPAPRHHARMRLLPQAVHRQRQLFVILFRAQRDPRRQIVPA